MTSRLRKGFALGTFFTVLVVAVFVVAVLGSTACASKSLPAPVKDASRAKPTVVQRSAAANMLSADYKPPLPSRKGAKKEDPHADHKH